MTGMITDLSIFWDSVITYSFKSMQMKKLILIILYAFISLSIRAQVEQLIIETYYVTDENDATDIDGGGVEAGAVTYRLFLDLAEGNKLKSIYGSPNHPLKFATTTKFFNNTYRDRSFGYQINKSNLDNNTVAIDTWLTMGFASNLNFGVPKTVDNDGSIVGGVNNDGGSELIAGGLLVNADSRAGISLTQADGLINSPYNVSGFFDIDFVGENGDDSTIFSSLSGKFSFTSHSARLINNLGISGIENDNLILIAQLTTTGELSYEINVEIERADGSIVNYVANDLSAGADTFYNKWLKYPLSCGCTDPNFLEFDKAATCDNGSCATPVIFGCMDPASCNYDPNANRNVPELCCYNSECALELGIICPGTVYGCTDPNSLNYNPKATATSDIDTCCYTGGCMDSHYLEYNPDACYDDGSYCKTLIIPGCMELEACNYNPFATVSDPDYCVFGCDQNNVGLDGKMAEEEANKLVLYPNPVRDVLYVDVMTDASVFYYAIYDIFGKRMAHGCEYGINGSKAIDLKSLPDGIYLFEIHAGEEYVTKKIIKQCL